MRHGDGLYFAIQPVKSMGNNVEALPMSKKYCLLSSIAGVALALTTVVSANGDKNAYNNPNGDPTTASFNVPFANYEQEGRMMIFCAAEELLVVVPKEEGALEVTCTPATW